MNAVPFEELFLAPLRNGVSYPSAQRGTGVRLVNMGEAFAFDVITDQDCERVPLTPSETERYLLREGDLLFVRQSLKYEGAGRCVLVGPAKEARTWDSHLIRVRLDPGRANPVFYYYYFRSEAGRRQVETIIEQVAAAGIRGSDLRRLMVPIPAHGQQDGVVEVLSALDDKIAVNERISETCAELATAMFHHEIWQPADPHSLPEGYSLGHLSGLCERIGNGGTPNRGVAEYWTAGTTFWFKTGELYDGPLLRSEETITDRALSGSNCSIWPAGTVLVALYGATVGKLGILTRPSAFNQACSALLAKAEVGEFVLFEILKAIRPRLQQLAVGAAQQNISQATLRNYEVAIAPAELSARYNEQARRLHLRRAAALTESRMLADLRDTLLSKLMSGEIRVREAEKAVEHAA